MAATVQAFDWLDILVNNAGIAIVKPFDDVTLDDFDRIVAVNVKGLFRGHAGSGPPGEGDRMINIGSINSERVHFAGGSLYVLTKATVAGLTSTLRAIWARAGITINNVQPG